MDCMIQCVKENCVDVHYSKKELHKHIEEKHSDIVQKVVYIKNGGYSFKLSMARQKELEELFKNNFDAEDDEVVLEKLSKRSNTLVLLYVRDKLESMAQISCKRLPNLSYLMVNHFCSESKEKRIGSRMMAELKHYANRNRFTSIVLQSLEQSIGFYEKQRFKVCDFRQMFKNSFQYIAPIDGNVEMQFFTNHYLRDRKQPWKWPMNFPQCDGAAKLQELIDQSYEDNWPEQIEKLYKQKLHELRHDVYQEAIASDQAWTHPLYFDIWYEKFRLLKEWFFDPCLERRFWSASAYFNALVESWGRGLIFLNHAWKSTRGFFPMCMKQFYNGASIVCIVTSQSLTCDCFTKYIMPLCEMEVMPPATFGGNYTEPLNRPVMAIYLFQPSLLNFIDSKLQKKKLTEEQKTETRQQRNLAKLERLRFVEQKIKEDYSRAQINKFDGVKLSDFDIVKKSLKKDNETIEETFWGVSDSQN